MMDVQAEDDVSVHDAKRLLGERRKERDLVYDQKICLEYLERIATLTPAQLKSVTEELSGIQILKPRYVALILSMMPDTEEEVEALFSKERTNLKKEEIKKIVGIVKKYKK
jgi:DNA-directed RNA polymerase subunit F